MLSVAAAKDPNRRALVVWYSVQCISFLHFLVPSEPTGLLVQHWWPIDVQYSAAGLSGHENDTPPIDPSATDPVSSATRQRQNVRLRLSPSPRGLAPEFLLGLSIGHERGNVPARQLLVGPLPTRRSMLLLWSASLT